MDIKQYVLKGKIILRAPLILPIFLTYLLGKQKKNLVNEDLKQIIKFDNGQEIQSYPKTFFKLFALRKEFRSQVYYRLKPWSFLFKFLPGQTAININCTDIGGGFYIHHGHSTRISARKIGKNFAIHHNCSIVHNNGIPIIGDNVFIGAGAIVMGNITIGDNVIIGAGAVVTKDVPSNTTVVSPHAYIIRRDGKRVNEKL